MRPEGGGSSRARSRAGTIPRGVWALGFVSLLMDASSELVHSLLPLLLVQGLGASALAVGLLEGAAEATAQVTKLFSGVLSDRLGRRKALVVAARLVDRVGKGVRGAPRDALIADITPPEVRGAAYGLRQALDTVGAVVGPLLAVGLMLLWAGDIRAVLWAAVVPAVAAVAVLVWGVREPERARTSTGAAEAPFRLREVAGLDAAYWWVVAIGAALTLARFSEAFLVLRAAGLGLAPTYAPLVVVAMSAAYAVSSYPAGVLADAAGRRAPLLAGLAALVAADLLLASATSVTAALVGAALWGLHMGLTQGLLSAMVADAAPPAVRGSAFGLFNLATGVALLVASVVAGALWDALGPEATFIAGAGLAALAGLGVLARGSR